MCLFGYSHHERYGEEKGEKNKRTRVRCVDLYMAYVWYFNHCVIRRKAAQYTWLKAQKLQATCAQCANYCAGCTCMFPYGGGWGNNLETRFHQPLYHLLECNFLILLTCLFWLWVARFIWLGKVYELLPRYNLNHVICWVLLWAIDFFHIQLNFVLNAFHVFTNVRESI